MRIFLANQKTSDLTIRNMVWASCTVYKKAWFDPADRKDPSDCTSFRPGPLGWDTLQLAVFNGTRVEWGVFWFGGSRSRLPDIGAGEAHHLRPWASGGRTPGSNTLWRG